MENSVQSFQVSLVNTGQQEIEARVLIDALLSYNHYILDFFKAVQAAST